MRSEISTDNVRHLFQRFAFGRRLVELVISAYWRGVQDASEFANRLHREEMKEALGIIDLQRAIIQRQEVERQESLH